MIPSSSMNYLLDYDKKNISEEYDLLMDDYEAAELGRCKEIMDDEMYMPCHKSRNWVRCFILTCSQPDSYRLYLDNNKHRFLLSAKKFSGVTLISNYEDFPMVEMKPKRGFIARVEQPTDSSFLVCLTRCHLCDGKLGRFTCGRAPDEREVVAKITHNFQRINNNNPLMMDFRSVTVTIPVVSDSGMRKIWCPRSFEISFPRDIGRSIDMNEVISRYSTMGERYLNKLPEWNEDYKSLVLKFQGNRVLTASSKNFLIYAESYFKREAAGKSSSARSNGDKPTDRSSSSSGSDGGDAKTHHSRYTGGRGSTRNNSRRSFHPGFESTTTTTATIEREREEDFESTTHLSNFDISGADFESSGFDENNSSLSTPIGKASGRSKKKTGGGDTTDVAVLQFGKSSSSKYVLDFKYPLSPIQAFGIALSTFTFQDSMESRKKFNPARIFAEKK